MARLTDRDQFDLLLPEDAYRAELLGQLDRVCPSGSIYHVLKLIPEQCEDVYTILVDDHTVASFDVPRGGTADGFDGGRDSELRGLSKPDRPR
ncbi:hypothetical protein [Bradyrhizobium sp. HKCCYLR20261]|uniref:hypothetical protein n=1 Tax=Bradyrhizobium sp. HKCCYLR20261 TaxID=3420760 RepID=UPI003EB809FD